MAMRVVERKGVMAKLANGDRVVFVEAGPYEAYEQVHIVRAIHLPNDEVEKLAPLYLGQKGVEVVVYDESGNAGFELARQLQRLGYYNVYYFPEGKRDWIDAGDPTESGERGFLNPSEESKATGEPAFSEHAASQGRKAVRENKVA